MVGLVTRLLIAEKVWDTLMANRGLADLGPEDKCWFMFGALGPAIGDFIPNAAPDARPSPYYQVWQSVLELAVGNPATGLPSLIQTIGTIQKDVDQLAQIVADRDFFAARDFKNSQLGTLKQATDDLNTIISNFASGSKLADIGSLVGLQSRPIINSTLAVASPYQWTGREWLHWKRPGDFAANLLQAAQASGKSHLIAYAMGWQVCYATLVCGSGFMNSVAGTSYRTYWWRTRWIANIVDAWVWGYYKYDGSKGPITFNDDDEPSVAYKDWPSLCSAGLHNWVDIAGGALDPASVAQAVVQNDPVANPLPALPAEFNDFTDLWLKAWGDTYNVPSAPLFTAEGLQAGYLLNWVVLWFQTSGDVIGCNPEPPLGLVPCPEPPWAKPGVNPDTGQPYKAPQPAASWDPSVGQSVCGFLLAVVGVILTLCGGAAVGVPLVIGGVDDGVNGLEQLNWDDLACQLFWLKWYAYNQLFNLHLLAAVGGFQPPYSSELADFGFSTIPGLPQLVSDKLWYYAGAVQNCKSRKLNSMLMTWAPTGGTDWIYYPPLQGDTFYAPGGAPTPNKVAYFVQEQAPSVVWPYGAVFAGELFSQGWWPSAIVDDDSTNQPLASIFTEPSDYNSGTPSFGPAYQAALAILREQPSSLPNWNLDGDRGLGWLTWQLTAPYPTAAQPVQTKKES